MKMCRTPVSVDSVRITIADDLTVFLAKHLTMRGEVQRLSAEVRRLTRVKPLRPHSAQESSQNW